MELKIEKREDVNGSVVSGGAALLSPNPASVAEPCSVEGCTSQTPTPPNFSNLNLATTALQFRKTNVRIGLSGAFSIF
jgi:hypothetical protein